MDAGRCFYPAIKFEFARFYKPQIKTSNSTSFLMSCRPSAYPYVAASAVGTTMQRYNYFPIRQNIFYLMLAKLRIFAAALANET